MYLELRIYIYTFIHMCIYIYIYFYLWIYKIVVLLVSCCHSRNDHHQAVFSLNKVLVYGGIRCHSFEKKMKALFLKRNL
jgi:hypothetical protein